MSYMKGQGATEYLVLLAVVLIIALVSIALLGFFPGMASDAKITQSNAYWRGAAKPFAIIEHSITSGSAPIPTLVIQNMDASQTLKIQSITFSLGANPQTPTLTPAVPISIAPGETRKITATEMSTLLGTTKAGAIYDLGVSIGYDSSYITGQAQKGAKNIMGKYT